MSKHIPPLNDMTIRAAIPIMYYGNNWLLSHTKISINALYRFKAIEPQAGRTIKNAEQKRTVYEPALKR